MGRKKKADNDADISAASELEPKPKPKKKPKPKVVKTFEDIFMEKHGPKNGLTKKAYPVKTKGKYEGVPFFTNETKVQYSVEILGIKKPFTNALYACNWLKERVHAHRTKEMLQGAKKSVVLGEDI